MAMNVVSLTLAAKRSIICILLNQRLLLEIAAGQAQDSGMGEKIQKRIETTDKEVAGLKRL